MQLKVKVLSSFVSGSGATTQHYTSDFGTYVSVKPVKKNICCRQTTKKMSVAVKKKYYYFVFIFNL